MAIDLATKFLPYVDEQFTAESKLSIITNQDFDWTGAHTVRVYKVSTSKMNDYDKPGAGAAWSRYGEVKGLDATTEELTLKRDRSFTFAVDKLDGDETAGSLSAAAALARQLREVVIPEVDSYALARMCAGAGTTGKAALTAANIYDKILEASLALDNALVPETERYLIVTPSVYLLLKKNVDIAMETSVGNDLRLKGVIGMIDGVTVIKVPDARAPGGFGFLMAHPSASVAPVKLEDYKIHQDPPGISGSLVEGRICYDAFVLDNKARGLFYHAQA